ncbi:MAG TPA: TetR family transcriptional regulator, partial [Dermatophilaceae bacterium]
SKEDLLYLISRTGHERTLALVRQAVAGSDDVLGQLLAVVRAFTTHHLRDHTSARVVNYELDSLSPEHWREIVGIRRAIEQAMKDIVGSGVASGAFHTANPRMSVLALLSLGVDVSRWFRDEGEWTPEEIADYYCEVALRVVGADR